MKRHKFVKLMLKRTAGTPALRGEAFAPANIALCKYWGKRDADLNLPVNSSLSISLGKLGTKTIVKFAKTADKVFLNGKAAPEEFAARVCAWLDLFRADGQFFEVRTKNNLPTAAGLASSASGFAALAMAMDQLMGWGFNSRELSMLARLGSGSAARSLYKGFAVWHAGVRADGMDSYAESFSRDWKEFRIGILDVSSDRKKTGSTDGMNHTVETSELYEAWPAQADCDFDALRTAVAAQDFPMLGKIAENNALAMHATMLAAWPPLCYWKPQTLAFMQEVWQARETGLELYFTIDAGPNLKLLFLARDARAVKKIFPSVQIVNPFPKA
jgi:diphosphomevalonate decarboxylase